MSNKRLMNKQIWNDRIQAWSKSSLSAQKWCEEHRITYTTFLYWKKKLASSDFIEISYGEKRIELRIGSISLFLSEDFNEKALVRCLQVIQKC